MSLVRLLTSGKSLVGVQDTPNSYRLTHQRLLPQFGPARNPFSSKAKSNGRQAQGLSLRASGGEGASEAGRGVSSSGGMAVAGLQSGARDRTAAGNVGGQELPGVRWHRAAALFNSVRAKLSGWFGAARGKVVKPAIPRFPKPPVQGELSLDRVRVVRNDLRDADPELVPAREPAAPTKPAAAPQGETKPGLAEGRWGRVANRIFRAGKA